MSVNPMKYFTEPHRKLKAQVDEHMACIDRQCRITREIDFDFMCVCDLALDFAYRYKPGNRKLIARSVSRWITESVLTCRALSDLSRIQIQKLSPARQLELLCASVFDAFLLAHTIEPTSPKDRIIRALLDTRSVHRAKGDNPTDPMAYVLREVDRVPSKTKDKKELILHELIFAEGATLSFYEEHDRPIYRGRRVAPSLVFAGAVERFMAAAKLVKQLSRQFDDDGEFETYLGEMISQIRSIHAESPLRLATVKGLDQLEIQKDILGPIYERTGQAPKKHKKWSMRESR